MQPDLTGEEIWRWAALAVPFTIFGAHTNKSVIFEQ